MTQLDTDIERLQHPVQLIKYLFTRGTSAFLIVFGRRETGKTDFSLHIAETLWTEGIIKQFATNIKIYDAPFPIQRIDNLDDLRLWSQNTSGKKLWIFDEFGKAMRRRSPMSSLNVKLIDDFQVLRKHKLSTLAVTVNEKYVDNVALGEDILDGAFLKPNYSNPKVALYVDYLEDFTRRIENIPATTIRFDTWDVATFKEHGVDQKPVFKDRDLDVCWEWAHGKTAKALGLHSMQLNRILRKFVKEVMERESHVSL